MAVYLSKMAATMVGTICNSPLLGTSLPAYVLINQVVAKTLDITVAGKSKSLVSLLEIIIG